jgi:LysR family glycine cleavage system transcriptional activator
MATPDWYRLPSLTALRAFEATARLTSFTGAARALNVTHAAVAQQVRGLEAELGVGLVQRSGRGLALTDEGQRLAQALGDAFGTIAAAVEATRQGERRRGLRVTATPVLTQSLLLPKLGDFWAAHPEITVSVTPTYDVIDIVRDGFDLAIRSGPAGASWPGLETELLFNAQYILVGSPALRARGEDVAKLPWIGPFDRNETRILRESGLDPERLSVNGVESPVLSVPAAIQGLGLMFTPDMLVRADITAGRLVRFPFRDLTRFAYYLSVPPGPRRPAVVAFIDWLRAVVA